MDENSWRWQKPDGTILAACACHVDDMAIAGPQNWLDEHYNAFVAKFKKDSRQQLPFEHCAATYEQIPMGIVWCRVSSVAKSNQPRSQKAEKMMTDSTAKR